MILFLELDGLALEPKSAWHQVCGHTEQAHRIINKLAEGECCLLRDDGEAIGYAGRLECVAAYLVEVIEALTVAPSDRVVGPFADQPGS